MIVSEYHKTVSILSALSMAAAEVHETSIVFQGGPADHSSDQTHAEMRDSISKLNDSLFEVLSGYVGPVWGCLQEETRLACRSAGMGNT